ncbi:ARM repeat-containing protein [Hypoxylon sp. FL1284]|nr:ARM repeat-containing protein [Hypoxylon sp. FL1284]
MAGNSSTARNDFFKELKPPCVAINNLTVRAPDKKAAAKDLTAVVENLYAVLNKQISSDASVLDEKLAEYVFFPLSNILRNQQQYPIRLIELTIGCLRILIQHGWKSKIYSELSQQLLIFLTFVIGGVPGQEKKKDRIPEETELEALRTLTSLIKVVGSSLTGSASLVDAKAVPTLGHAVSIILDSITDGRTPDIQFEALRTLDALVAAIRDQGALATFLPGLVSSLSRLLTLPAALKTQRRVLIGGINTLKDVLTKVIGDIKVMGIMTKQTTDGDEQSEGKVLTPAWLKATTSKIKLALASVLKMRNTDSEEVRVALERLCITLLDECHQSLVECTSILVETAMILADEEGEKSVLETSLTDLARIYPELGDAIKTTVYNWVTSLPRLAQSSDEKVKQQAIQNLIKGQHFITTLQVDSSILEDSLAASLRDSATALVLASKPSTMTELPPDAIELNMEMVQRDGSSIFPPVLIAQETERSTRTALLDLLSNVGSISQRGKLAADLLNYVQESTGPSQVASYWMAFEMVKASLAHPSDLDDFLDLSLVSGTADESELILQEIYTFSVTVLDSQTETEEVDWRLQAIALEVATFAASRMKEGFRPELIDILYPITTLLGSGISKLRDHAIISLNSIASSCGYSNVTGLIIDNVDYMVNSVSLRLNTFDISPASTQVLRMMVRLTGPRLIPYLDDVIASIFAALDNYHGYPLFVESLFSVLTEVVQQGSQSDHLLLTEAKASATDHKKRSRPVVTIEEVNDTLSGVIERREKRRQEDVEVEEIEHHPGRPWKSAEAENETSEETDESNTEVEKPPPPKTPTFKILARITDLTQHYLTSPTPTLRKSLLDLLATVCPALSPDEEAFLPLVNSVWPVLVERLYDPEPFVVISACKALGTLCQSAGDFLNTRIKTEWWDNLGKWCRKVKADATQSRGKAKSKAGARSDEQDHGLLIPIRTRDGIEGKEASSRAVVETVPSAGLGRFAQAAQVWEAVQELLVAVASFVQLDDDVLDQILALLAEALATDAPARAALQAVDPDAVWLLMYERGLAEPMDRPVLDGVDFVDLWNA